MLIFEIKSANIHSILKTIIIDYELIDIIYMKLYDRN